MLVREFSNVDEGIFVDFMTDKCVIICFFAFIYFLLILDFKFEIS